MLSVVEVFSRFLAVFGFMYLQVLDSRTAWRYAFWFEHLKTYSSFSSGLRSSVIEASPPPVLFRNSLCVCMPIFFIFISYSVACLMRDTCVPRRCPARSALSSTSTTSTSFLHYYCFSLSTSSPIELGRWIRLPLLALRQRVPVSPLVRGRCVTIRIFPVGILERLLAACRALRYPR